jgi:hypothetical protein
MRRVIALTLISACMAGGAAACGSGGSGGSGSSGSRQSAGSPAAGPQASGTGQVMTVMQQWARCIRSHGLPGWPDPIINPVTSYPDFPQDAPRIPASIRQSCQSITNRLPPQAQASHPPTAKSMQSLLRFARCMRSHGIPGWPDPNALGEFPIMRQMITQVKGASHPAVAACVRYVPGGGQYLHFVAASAPQPAPGAGGNG